MIPSNPGYLPKAPPLSTIELGVGFQGKNLQRMHSVHDAMNIIGILRNFPFFSLNFLKLVLLSYNLHAVKCTYFKGTVQ